MTIDWWTLGIQAVNVLILIWLLSRFFWRPIAAMIEQRRSAVQAALDDAKTKQDEASAALAEIERTRSGFAAEREAILAGAKAEAEQLQRAKLDEAAKAAEEVSAAANAAIGKEQKAAQRAWEDRSSELAVNIAKRLIARLGSPAAGTVFLGWLIDKIRALPPDEHALLASPDARLEIVSDSPLGADEQSRCQALIAEVLGSEPQIAFTIDPELIAGLELRSANLVITNSWRADLGHILADLVHDKRG